MQQPTMEQMSKRLAGRQIDRRQFMTHALATGLGVAAATSLADKAEAAIPKKGGTLRAGIGHGSTGDSLDPGLFENDFMINIGFGYQGYLTKILEDGSLVPSVAESWEASADALTWRFKLREGIEFHNGRTVGIDDIVASINHHRGEGSTSAASPLVSSVTDIRKDGKDAVVFTLATGNADFPHIVSDYHMPIMQANADGTMDWQSMVGCGVYRIDHLETGVACELSRYDNHWDDSIGHFDGVQMFSLIDPNARTAALVSGDVDVIDRVEPKIARLLGRKPGVNVHSVAGTQHYSFPMRTDMAPWDDNNVRQALKWAIDREELVEKILFGYGAVGNDHPIGPDQRFFNKDLEQKTFDPDKAKFYLRQAGLNSLSVPLSSAEAAFAGAVDAAVLMQNSATKAGITIDVVREPDDGYWGDVWMNKGWCACYWSGRPVEDIMFSTAYKSGVAWNDSFWSNERFDRLLVEARGELDANKRREMYYEMQDIVANQGGVAIPMFASYVFATSDSVGHPDTFGTTADLDGYRFTERWWKV